MTTSDTISDIEKSAAHLDEPPKNLSAIDELVFFSLRGLYAQYRAGLITRENAKVVKRRIYLCKKALLDQQKVIFDCANTVKKTEIARVECRKNPTAENALRLCGVIDGVF